MNTSAMPNPINSYAGVVTQRAPVELVYRKIGNSLRKIREGKDVTLPAIAAKANISRPYLIQVENGERRVHLHTLIKICKALEIKACELLND